MSESKAPLKMFPSGSVEAIALFYIQNQDLSGKTPEEIYDMYVEAYNRVSARKRETRGKWEFQ